MALAWISLGNTFGGAADSSAPESIAASTKRDHPLGVSLATAHTAFVSCACIRHWTRGARVYQHSTGASCQPAHLFRPSSARPHCRAPLNPAGARDGICGAKSLTTQLCITNVRLRQHRKPVRHAHQRWKLQVTNSWLPTQHPSKKATTHRQVLPRRAPRTSLSLDDPPSPLSHPPHRPSTAQTWTPCPCICLSGPCFCRHFHVHVLRLSVTIGSTVVTVPVESTSACASALRARSFRSEISLRSTCLLAFTFRQSHDRPSQYVDTVAVAASRKVGTFSLGGATAAMALACSRIGWKLQQHVSCRSSVL